MTTTSCRGRDATKLQAYINDPEKQKKAFAKALLNDGFLNSFNGQVEASECIFSYPDSEWYAVYLVDQDGNKYWNQQDQRFEMYFFKLALSPNKKDAFTREGTTDITKTDLQGRRACVVNDRGNCVLPPTLVKSEPKPKKAPVAKKKESTPEESTTAVASDVLSRLQTLSLNPEEPAATEQVPREYFEQMKNKMLIVQWMVEKMKVEDLVECIKRGSVSPDDIRRAEATLQTAPEPSFEGSSSADEQVALEAAVNLPQGEVKKMFKRITKESLIEDLKREYPGDKKLGIIEMCKRAGKKLEIRDTKRGPKLFDYAGEQVSEEDALNECAEFEAARAQQRLLSRWSGIMRKAARIQRTGKFPAMEQPVLPSQVQVGQITAESIIGEINEIDDPVAKKQAIIELSAPFGYTTKQGKRGILIIDPDGEQVSDQIALEECAALKAATIMSVASFGRVRASKKQLSVRKKFKAAAKKCKGKSNYTKCMSKLLRKRV
jgi:hypothetical protein